MVLVATWVRDDDSRKAVLITAGKGSLWENSVDAFWRIYIVIG
jgi:hypothetical protein